jgi:hypothetical protein
MEGFIDKRSCPNANEVVQHARLVLAPLRFWQELKEIIRSYAMWNPSVTTSIGMSRCMVTHMEWFITDDQKFCK